MTRPKGGRNKGDWIRNNVVRQCLECNGYYATAKHREDDGRCRSCKRSTSTMANVITGKEAGVGGGAWAHLPADIYDGALESYEEKVRALDQYNDDPEAMRLTLKFRLDDLPDDLLDRITTAMKSDEQIENPVHMLYWVNKTLSEKANLAPVLDALGVPWGVGVPTDLDDMIEKRCRLVVGRKVPKGKTEEIAFVQSVVPAKAATPDAPKRAAPATAIADALLCVVCDEPASSYDPKGKAICPKHGGLAE